MRVLILSLVSFFSLSSFACIGFVSNFEQLKQHVSQLEAFQEQISDGSEYLTELSIVELSAYSSATAGSRGDCSANRRMTFVDELSFYNDAIGKSCTAIVLHESLSNPGFIEEPFSDSKIIDMSCDGIVDYEIDSETSTYEKHGKSCRGLKARKLVKTSYHEDAEIIDQTDITVFENCRY